MRLFKVSDLAGIIDNLEVHAVPFPWVMVTANNATDLLRHFVISPQVGQDLSGERDTFFLMILVGLTMMPSLSFVDADVMEVGGTQHHTRIAAFTPHDLLGLSGHISGVADPLEVFSEIAFHFNDYPILQETLLL
jgi:hypothetical protein